MPNSAIKWINSSQLRPLVAKVNIKLAAIRIWTLECSPVSTQGNLKNAQHWKKQVEINFMKEANSDCSKPMDITLVELIHSSRTYHFSHLWSPISSRPSTAAVWKELEVKLQQAHHLSAKLMPVLLSWVRLSARSSNPMSNSHLHSGSIGSRAPPTTSLTIQLAPSTPTCGMKIRPSWWLSTSSN